MPVKWLSERKTSDKETCRSGPAKGYLLGRLSFCSDLIYLSILFVHVVTGRRCRDLYRVDTSWIVNLMREIWWRKFERNEKFVLTFD